VTRQSTRGFVEAVERLLATDPSLARIVDTHGPPPFWTREPGLPALVLFILEQQVSLASAAAAYGRLEARTGQVTPATILASTDEELRADGFSRQKSGYVRALSNAVLEGDLAIDALAGLPDADARAALVTLNGVGTWTADVYLLSCLRRPDVWPVGDRALQVSAFENLELSTIPTPPELESIGDRWRPHRSTAARILWHGYLAKRGR
jgi:DNA-3-methyladenine glycosylase II